MGGHGRYDGLVGNERTLTATRRIRNCNRSYSLSVNVDVLEAAHAAEGCNRLLDVFWRLIQFKGPAQVM